MKKLPSITVAIPVYNRLDLFKRTIESVFKQSVMPDETVVVDDASTEEGLWEYLKSLKGIRALRNKRNLGAIVNYNKCIKLAKSEYVVSLASDDLLVRDYIKTWKK